MMENDIILNGVRLLEIKAMKDKITPSAVKFVAEKIDAATTLIEEILELGEKEAEADTALMDLKAIEAKAHLENAQLVAGVTGVTFFLPFSESWGDPGDTPYSSRLEEMEEESEECSEVLRSLYSILERMEYDSKNWHSSNC